MPRIGDDLHVLSSSLLDRGWDRSSYDPVRDELQAYGQALGEVVCLVAFSKPGVIGIDKVFVLDGDLYLELTLDSSVPEPMDASNLLFTTRRQTEEARESATTFTNGRFEC